MRCLGVHEISLDRPLILFLIENSGGRLLWVVQKEAGSLEQVVLEVAEGFLDEEIFVRIVFWLHL